MEGSNLWKFCSQEHSGVPCMCTGFVRFGAPGHWACAAVSTSHVECASDVFGGDPWPGHNKKCYCMNAEAELLKGESVPEVVAVKEMAPYLEASFTQLQGCCRTASGGTGTLKHKVCLCVSQYYAQQYVFAHTL